MKSHEYSTRNNGHTIAIPKINLKYASGSFWFMGARLFNDLPLDIRKMVYSSEFDRLLKTYFFQ